MCQRTEPESSTIHETLEELVRLDWWELALLAALLLIAILAGPPG